MIRLATAHSKLRLSRVVATGDIDIAVNLIHLSIFGEVADGDDDEAMEDEGVGPARSQPVDRSSRPSRAATRGK